ncbi:MAG: FtsH protease activity modulator HflK [Thermoanaerobaculia bacterium]
MAADGDRRGERVPPSVGAILRLRDLVERRWPSLALVALVLALAITAAAGVYTVDNGETAALLRFGELVDDAVKPGLQTSWPGMHEVVKARTGDVFRVAIEGDFDPRLSLVTGDENLVEVSIVVQYRIQDLSRYLFASENPEELLRQVVRAALVQSFVATPVDEVLTSGKAAIQNAVRKAAQQRLDGYGAGVTVVAVNLQTVDPPREAAGSFRAVSDARAEAAQSIQRAGGERDRALRLARGEAEKLVTEARATADRRLQEARGAADRFQALLRQKRQSPDLTRTELYLATLQKVLPVARLILLAPGEPPKIDVHLLERSGERKGIPPGVSFDDR